VRFTTLAALANELQEAESRRELARVVGRYARTELVVLDELGYLALPEGAAMAKIESSITWAPGGTVSAHRRLEFGSRPPAPTELGEIIAEAVADDDGRVTLDGFEPLQAVWLCGRPLQADEVMVVGAFSEAEDTGAVSEPLLIARNLEGA